MSNPLQKMMTDLLALSPEEYPGRKNIRVVSPFETSLSCDDAKRKLEYFIDDDVMHLGSCSFFKNDEIRIVTVSNEDLDRDLADYIIKLFKGWPIISINENNLSVSYTIDLSKKENI